MKRELKVLLGLLTIIMTAFIIMPSCSEDDDMIVGQPSPRGFLHHGPTMVITYTEFAGLDPDTVLNDIYDYRKITLRETESGWLGERNIIIPDIPLSYNTKGLWKFLCNENGDTAFNENVALYDTIYHNRTLQCSFIEDVQRVQVTALTDYDGNHKAGSSLDDIAILSYVTLYPYVKEGYKINERSIGNGVYPPRVEYEMEYCKANYPDDDPERYIQNQFYPSYFGIFYFGIGHGRFNRELFHHCLVGEITKDNPIRMMGSYAINSISFAHAPEQECRIKVAITVQMRGGKYPAKTLTAEYRVK